MKKIKIKRSVRIFLKDFMKGYEIKTLILDIENNRLYENEGLCI